MSKRSIDAGLRRHRPEKKFRFEYIQGRYGGMTRAGWNWRLFGEVEREMDGIKWMREVLKDYWENRNKTG